MIKEIKKEIGLNSHYYETVDENKEYISYQTVIEILDKYKDKEDDLIEENIRLKEVIDVMQQDLQKFKNAWGELIEYLYSKEKYWEFQCGQFIQELEKKHEIEVE